jgi:16S rRNA (uracil1498-N3)-methyltransferase
MHRFYSADADFNQKKLIITDPDEVHHMKDVLRLKKGAVIQIFNGKNEEADVLVDVFTANGLKVNVQSVRQALKAKGRIILACAPPKKDKFEWIIEKCTELGVDDIIPLKTKRSEVIFTTERMVGKLARFEKIVMNAAKQSKRMNIPKVHGMTDLADVLKGLDPKGIHLFPSLNDHPVHIKEALSQASSDQTITIFIGPEGDFTPDEVRMAKEAGCMPVSLGNTVLKVETAAVATVSFVRFLLKD